MTIRKQWITRWVLNKKQVPAGTPGAKKVRSRSKKYYGDNPVSGARPKRVPLSESKSLSISLYAGMLERAEKERCGRHDPTSRHAQVPLSQHIEDFGCAIRAGRRGRKKPPNEQAVVHVLRMVSNLCAACKFVYLRDLDLSKLEAYLGRLAQSAEPEIPPQTLFTMREVCSLLGVKNGTVSARCNRQALPRVGKGPATRYPRETVLALAECRRGLSQGTVADYAGAARRFTRWLFARQRIGADPFAELQVSRPDRAERHPRRPLSSAELERFLATTRASTKRFRRLAGIDRWALYLTALSTGYRRGELAALTPECFLLDEVPPVVVLGYSHTKNDLSAIQPLPEEVVPLLREYLQGKPAGRPVWPGNWRWVAADMIRRDLGAAGVAPRSNGPDGPLFADFHALRHSFVALLKRAGVTLSQAMRLARHSDPRLTLAVYGREDLEELAGAVGKIGAGMVTVSVAPDEQKTTPNGPDSLPKLPGQSATKTASTGTKSAKK